MEWDTAQRILRTGMVISFLVAALGIVGELLGWWNDLGELLMTTGTVSGLVLGATSVIGNASRAQVAGLAEGVEGVAQRIDGVSRGVDGVAQGVAQANETLGEQNEKLGQLDKLGDIDEGLEQQVDLLTQIRDRL